MTSAGNGKEELSATSIYALIQHLGAELDKHRTESSEQIVAANAIGAATLKAMVQMQQLISGVIESLADTRDNRYQEEIDGLEAQIGALQMQMAEKIAAKSATHDTNERMRQTAHEVAAELKAKEEEAKSAKRIDWARWFIDKVLPYIATAATLGLILRWDEVVRALFGANP